MKKNILKIISCSYLFLFLITLSVINTYASDFRTVKRVIDGDTIVNAEIIKQGFGFAYTKYPFKYMDEFKDYEKNARKAGKGLWADQ